MLFPLLVSSSNQNATGSFTIGQMESISRTSVSNLSTMGMPAARTTIRTLSAQGIGSRILTNPGQRLVQFPVQVQGQPVQVLGQPIRMPGRPLILGQEQSVSLQGQMNRGQLSLALSHTPVSQFIGQGSQVVSQRLQFEGQRQVVHVVPTPPSRPAIGLIPSIPTQSTPRATIPIGPASFRSPSPGSLPPRDNGRDPSVNPLSPAGGAAETRAPFGTPKRGDGGSRGGGGARGGSDARRDCGPRGGNGKGGRSSAETSGAAPGHTALTCGKRVHIGRAVG